MPVLNPEQSHTHALETLKTLNRYADFLDNIETVADMGCGLGYDALWWASLAKDDGTPRNITVQAFDLIIDPNVLQKHANIKYNHSDYTVTGLAKETVDFVWAHNSFQYTLSPIHTLLHWWDIMKTDAMLLISVPYNFGIDKHRDIEKVDIEHSFGSYFNWSLGNLIMILAATGFDVRNSHFRFDRTNGWIQAAVYKLPGKPQPSMNWYDMCDQKMLPISIESAILKKGTFNDTDIVCDWIDRSQYILAV